MGDKKNVVMRLKSTVDDTGQEKDESQDFVICMTAEKFRVLHHGNLESLLYTSTQLKIHPKRF